MVLAEQIKEIEQRREALERCLDIDQKRIDLRNEEEKTQEPNFWDNPDKAREQLRKVAGIKAWVDDYDAIRKDAQSLAKLLKPQTPKSPPRSTEPAGGSSHRDALRAFTNDLMSKGE